MRKADQPEQADKNLDFFLGHLSNTHGEGGEVWLGESFYVPKWGSNRDSYVLTLTQKTAITT